MSTPSERPEPWWQTNLGAGIIGGTISGVAVAVLLGAASQAAATLAAIPPWALWLIAAVAVVAALVAIPRTRRGLRRGAKAVRSVLPVRRGRFDEIKALLFDMTTRAVQSDQARKMAERDAAASKSRFERSVDDLTDALQRAQGQAREAESARDSALRDLTELTDEHSRLLTAALEAQKKAAAKSREAGSNAGVKLGRLIERYGDDWPELSSEQQAERKRQVDGLKAKREALQPRVQKLEGDLVAANSIHHRELREQFEAGRAQGRAEATQQLQPPAVLTAAAVFDSGRAATLSPRASEPLPAPRWLLKPGNPDDWRLINLVRRSIARDCRLEADDRGQAGFVIRDAAVWDVLDGGTEVVFKGGLTRWGMDHGATVFLDWHGADGKHHRDWIKIEPSR